MSAVTFISIGSAVNISSTWASPWNTLARLTYLPIFQSVLVGIHYRQLGQGLEKPVQRAPDMFTVLHKPRHGTTWVAPLLSRLLSQWNCGSIMETPHPSGSGFTQHIHKSVLLSCTLTIWLPFSGGLIMFLYMTVDVKAKHNGEKDKHFWKISKKCVAWFGFQVWCPHMQCNSNEWIKTVESVQDLY